MARRALVLAAVLVFVVGIAGAVGGAPRGQSSDATPNGSTVAGTPDLLATVQAKATTDAETVAQTVTAITTRNAELEAALAQLATSEADARQAAEQAQAHGTAALGTAQAQIASNKATIEAQATEIVGWQATGTAIALPTATPTQPPTPTATPTPTPTATPTPPAAGTVLYLADESGGFRDWQLSEGWRYQNGLLLFRPQLGSELTITAPYEMPGLTRFAVEVEVQNNSYSSSAFRFGISVRSTDGQGVWGGISDGAGLWAGRERSGDTLIAADLPPDLPKEQRHILRLEVDGDSVRLLIDGTLVLESVADQPIAAEQIGLWGESYPATVYSFTVVAL